MLVGSVHAKWMIDRGTLISADINQLDNLRPVTLIFVLICFVFAKMVDAIVKGKADVPATEGNYADELLSQIWQHSIESPNRPAFVSFFG